MKHKPQVTGKTTAELGIELVDMRHLSNIPPLYGAKVSDLSSHYDFLYDIPDGQLSLVHVGLMRYSPIHLAFAEQNEDTVYMINPQDAIASDDFMNRLSELHRAIVREIAELDLPKPDYSTWTWISTDDPNPPYRPPQPSCGVLDDRGDHHYFMVWIDNPKPGAASQMLSSEEFGTKAEAAYFIRTHQTLPAGVYVRRCTSMSIGKNHELAREQLSQEKAQ